MSIAIFGGSFDPVHIGHEQIVYKVLQNITIDKLIIVPTYLNPFKNEFHLNPKDRFNLLYNLFDNDKIEISKFEIEQRKAVPSIQTVKYFQKQYPLEDIYLIIGADNLESLHLWHKFQELKNLVKFIVISRDGYEVKNDIIQFINIKMDIDISSTTLREDLKLKYIPKKIQQKVNQIWKNEFKEL
jgi:nicotinate-nucleotide adenylyltransferase